MKTVTADQKRRIVLPGAEPGEVYQIFEIEPGHLEITKMVPAPRKPKSPAELHRLLHESPLTPSMSWEALRRETREW